jgi:hypothetical protein
MISDSGEPLPGSPPGASRGPGKSPLPFILGWFVMPLTLVLVLEALGVPERLSGWVSSWL